MSKKRQSWLFIVMLVMAPIVALYVALSLATIGEPDTNGRAKDIVDNHPWQVSADQE